MSNLRNINTKLPAESIKHKLVRKPSRLGDKYDQKGQVDYPPTDCQPNPIETFNVGPPTSTVHSTKT